MTAETWLSVRYRDFYDVPRLVAVEYGGDVYVFDSPFIEDRDDYADHYTVYRLPASAAARLEASSWENITSSAEEVGRVRVADVEFDATRRERLNASIFERLVVD